MKLGRRGKSASRVDDTTESPPQTTKPSSDQTKKKGKKRLGPRWNNMNAVMGDSVDPDFPRIQ